MDISPGYGIDAGSQFAYGAPWASDDVDDSSTADPLAEAAQAAYPPPLPSQADPNGPPGQPAVDGRARSPQENADASPQTGDDPTSSGWAAIGSFLQREFVSLEQTVAGALTSLFGGGNSQKPTGPSPSQGAPSFSAQPSTGSDQAPYANLVQSAAQRNQLDPALIDAVIGQESGFRADAESPAGAVGLMQLMPDTARELGVTDSRDPRQNVDAGSRMLRSLIDRFGGRLDLALAAYNAGPAAVERYGGVPPFPETQAYVRDVMSAYRERALGRSA